MIRAERWSSISPEEMLRWLLMWEVDIADYKKCHRPLGTLNTWTLMGTIRIMFAHLMGNKGAERKRKNKQPHIFLLRKERRCNYES